ncbi:PPE domain-containing protein [Nocardia sp. NPDC004415]
MTFTSFMTGLGAGVGNALGMGSGVGAAIGNRVGSLFEWDVSQTDTERKAQEDGNNERTRIYADNKALANGFNGEYTTQVVPAAMEDFTDMSHSRIMQFVNSVNIETMGKSIEGWQTLAKDTGTKGQAFHDNIAKEMERGWSGSAASQALASTKSYLADVGKVKQAAELIANKMEEARSGFQQVKYSVPHESDDQSTSKLGIVTSFLSPAAGLLIDATSSGRSDAAQDAAREVMKTVYKPVAEQSDTQVPKVPLPVDPSSDKPDDGKNKPTGNQNDNNNNQNGTKPTTTNPTTEDPTTEDPTTEDPSTDDPSDDDTTDDDTNPSTTQPDTTPETPTTTDPGTTPAGTTPSGLTPGGGSPGGSPGGGSPGGTPGGTPGTPTAGTPGSPNAAGAAGTAGTAGGRNGMTGMGGMGAPGGRGGGKDDENEHSAPDYLRGVHEELLGPDRLHVPPVIGGDA